MKIFNIGNSWSIQLPENWIEEGDEVDGHYIFFPPDSDLTIRISSFYFFRNIENGRKILAPVDDLSEIFNESIKKIKLRDDIKVEGKKLNLNEFKVKDSKIECYEYNYYENNEKVYSVSCGIMIAGYLLIINLYSASKEEVEKAMHYLFSIKEADPKEI